MRIAVVADIHGNAAALEAVLRDLRTASPDLVVNLGDHVSGPLWAAQTADLLMDQKGWMHIRGNHDRQLTGGPVEEMGLSDRAAIQQLQRHHLEWLRALPSAATVAESVFACHGAPDSDTEYLIEDVSSGFARIADTETLRCRLGARTGVVLCGHSHVPRFVRVDAATLAVNPGSVGLQAYYDSDHRYPHAIETGSPHARYLLLDRHGAGWTSTLRTVEYDHECAAELAEAGMRPEWAHALRTGFAPHP